MNEGEDTVSTVKHPYIIKNNNTIEDNIADKVIEEAMVDNASVEKLLISTQSEAEVLFIPWIDQEWWYLCQQAYL